MSVLALGANSDAVASQAVEIDQPYQPTARIHTIENSLGFPGPLCAIILSGEYEPPPPRELIKRVCILQYSFNNHHDVSDSEVWVVFKYDRIAEIFQELVDLGKKYGNEDLRLCARSFIDRTYQYAEENHFRRSMPEWRAALILHSRDHASTWQFHPTDQNLGDFVDIAENRRGEIWQLHLRDSIQGILSSGLGSSESIDLIARTLEETPKSATAQIVRLNDKRLIDHQEVSLANYRDPQLVNEPEPSLKNRFVGFLADQERLRYPAPEYNDPEDNYTCLEYLEWVTNFLHDCLRLCFSLPFLLPLICLALPFLLLGYCCCALTGWCMPSTQRDIQEEE